MDNREISTILTTQEQAEINYDKLIETVAPKFIDLYAKSNRTPEEQKQLENYAAEIISKTNFLENQLFERLNNQEIKYPRNKRQCYQKFELNRVFHVHQQYINRTNHKWQIA